MNSNNLRILGWVVPLLCMAGASYAGYSQFHRLKVAQDQKTVEQQKYNDAKLTLDQARTKVDKEGRYAAVPRVDAEQTDFLRDLRGRANRAGVSVVSMRMSTTPAGQSATDKDTAKAELLKGIDRVSCDLVIEGNYGPVRAFIEDLNQSTRLYTINSASWTRGAKGGTQLTITVSRYVTAPAETTPNRTEAKP